MQDETQSRADVITECGCSKVGGARLPTQAGRPTHRAISSHFRNQLRNKLENSAPPRTRLPLRIGAILTLILSLAAAAVARLENFRFGAATASAVPDSVWDPAVLRVPWAADFYPIAANQINVRTDSRLPVRAAGDGVADDAPAVSAAIRLASSSGGVYRLFPPG